MSKTNNFLIHNNFYESFMGLDNEESGILIKALFSYHLRKDYNIPENKIVQYAFNAIKASIDANKASYEDKCAQNSKNIQSRWDKKNTTVYERIPSDTTVYDRIQTYTNVSNDTNDTNIIEKNINEEKRNNKRKITKETVFCVGCQDWEFPAELKKAAQEYWTDETIRTIEQYFSCREYTAETSIGELLETQFKADKVKTVAIVENLPLHNDFDTFWNNYPKKRAGSKDKAKKRFLSIVQEKRATVDELIDGAKRYSASEEVARGFAKGCEAWLNDDRWTCDYSNTVSKKQIENQTRANELLEWATEKD